MATSDCHAHKSPYLDMKHRNTSGIGTQVARLRDLACSAPFPDKPSRPWAPAWAVTERAVTAWPVVAVGVTDMPAGTNPCAALPPHQSKHSPHLCLSLLSHGRDQGQLSLATDKLGSAKRFLSVMYPRRGRFYGQAEL
jgi:hypothetical protein